MTSRPDPRVGTDLGPYRIESVIGRGGMGVVYLATHTGLDRKVALKLLTPDYADDEGFRARFLRESKLAASIDHPNIIPVYDAGEIAGTFYLAMRYVEGMDLETRLRQGALTPRQSVHLLAQVGSALDAAHEAGLVHRDVKPANILIASGKGVDRDDHAYLTDFGLTKHRGSQTGLTRAGGFIGTLEYIAPEQIEGKTVDGRADQYALAAIAVGCLTGQPPYPRDSDVAIINAHLHDPPPSIHLRRAELPVAVDTVISRGLAKKPDDRYPDCKAFADDLRAALGVTETQTRPRSAGVRDRRVPLVVGLALVIGAAVILVAGWAWFAAGGLGSAASPSLSSTSSSVASSTPSPSLTEDVFPNPEEADLLEKLPPDLRATCSRGTYRPLSLTLFESPSGSLNCEVTATDGVNELLVRAYIGSYPKFFVNEYLGSNRIPEGDCATSTRAHGVWARSGQDTGSILCYVESATGDAILYWTYDDSNVLVKATNKKGDSGALYDYFTQHARFMAP